MPIEQITINDADGAVIGASSTQKVGFYGKTPVVQGGVVTTVTTGETVMAAAINAIIARLQDIGIIATP
jgi:hypothetical protein